MLSRLTLLPCAAAFACLTTFATAQAPRLQETWETGYEKDDASGAHVLGYWRFDDDKALLDSSGKGHDLTLRGAVTAAKKGKQGGALESFPGFPVVDKNHGAITPAKSAGLSPKAAFTLEMWVKPKPELEPRLRPHLLDKKYVDHTDYQWTLSDADKAGKRRLTATLGFGSESKIFSSEPIILPVGEWHHLAFVYDGAGTGHFYRDGEAVGQMSHAGCGSIAPGLKALSIGDRLGSNYGGFPGYIDEVRICEGMMNFAQVAMQITAARQVWRRLELDKKAQVTVTNLRRESMTGARLQLTFGPKTETYELPKLASGKAYTATLNLDLSLKPGLYPLRARLLLTEPKAYSTEQQSDFEIVARPLPFTLPVVMWGAGHDELERLKHIGFTHYIGIGASTDEIWKTGKPAPVGKPEAIEKTRRSLDAALSAGLGVVASLSPAAQVIDDPKYQRVDRNGKPYERIDICASLPELAPFFENVGRSVAKDYGDHPAFSAALIDTEVRDHNNLSFNTIDVESYRKFANADIPAEAIAKWGVDYTKLKSFPADRVLPDDDPLLKYYRWFWTVGDGWNALHTALNRGVKYSGRRDLWTWFDPAVRQPSISGAGGSVDVLSHWTYTYPAPLSIGLCTDQLAAMSAASGKNQKLMKMTQLIWYRSQTAPIGSAKPGDTVAWEDHDPDAAYITIAPMHLREAFWTKIARPITGIMYHGWQSLVPTDSTGAYRFTHPDTVEVLRQLLHEVAEPLGPALVQIPDERSEIAFVESFASQMFARRGVYGNNTGWPADVWLALQHSHLQCDVVYEELLAKSGPGSTRKLLIMPDCDVLPRSVVDKIQAWQKRGGKIIADENLCPALKADVVIPRFVRSKKATEDKAKVLELAKTLGPQARALGLTPRVTCDNPEIILRTRRAGDALYVFAVNDHREPGSYVGQHGLVMENGLPSSGVITLPGEEANVYELTRSRLVVPQRVEGGVTWSIDLAPCDGRIYMITPKPLLELAVTAPAEVTPSNSAELKIALRDSRQNPVKATIPLRLDLRDANGKAAEGSGYYATKDGELTVKLDIASNETPGTWSLRIRELASGMEATRYLRVTQPGPKP